MKLIYFLLIFAVGFITSRWSVHDPEANLTEITQATSSLGSIQDKPVVTTHVADFSAEKKIQTDEFQILQDSNMVRTDEKIKDKQIRQLFSRLMEANEKDQIEEQNKLFREMESLNPLHETVFQARVMFLQDDEDWQGAHDVLKECVTIIPNSVYCLRRLANIRSSNTDEKLRYGNECIQASKNDPLCLVDVAMALYSKGDFVKAKEYFEQALNLPPGNEGYNKEYLLFQYSRTLESLGLYPKAKIALTEACKLNMKSACEELQHLGK